MVEVSFTNRKTFQNHDLVSLFQQILHFSQYRKRPLPPVKIQKNIELDADLTRFFLFYALVGDVFIIVETD